MALQAGAPAQILQGGQHLVHPYPVPDVEQRTQELFRLPVPWTAIPQDIALVGIIDATQDAQQGGLARAIAALNLQHLPLLQLQVQIGKQHTVITLTEQLRRRQHDARVTGAAGLVWYGFAHRRKITPNVCLGSKQSGDYSEVRRALPFLIYGRLTPGIRAPDQK